MSCWWLPCLVDGCLALHCLVFLVAISVLSCWWLTCLVFLVAVLVLSCWWLRCLVGGFLALHCCVLLVAVLVLSCWWLLLTKSEVEAGRWGREATECWFVTSSHHHRHHHRHHRRYHHHHLHHYPRHKDHLRLIKMLLDALRCTKAEWQKDNKTKRRNDKKPVIEKEEM